MTRPTRPHRTAILAIWLWALGFTLAGVALYHGQIERLGTPRSEVFRDFNLQRLEAFGRAVPEGEALRIVAIGNSRLKYATLDDAEMTALARAEGLGSVGFLRLVNNWAVFEDFVLLTDAVLALDPDVVVLQLDLLGLERARQGRKYIQRDFIAWQLFGFSDWNPRGERPALVQYAKPCLNDKSEAHLNARLHLNGIWVGDDLEGMSARLAREFVLEAASAGIRVVIATVPQTADMEIVHPTDRANLLGRAAALVETDPDIALRPYPGALPDEMYCDFVHMNDDGRRRYAAWLLRTVAR